MQECKDTVEKRLREYLERILTPLGKKQGIM